MRPSPPPCSTSTSHSTPHSTSHSTSHSTPHSTSHSTPSSSISSIQAQRQRWEQRCIRTSTELLQTERTYCAQLRLVTTYFVELLEAKGTLKADVRKKVFSSSREIHNLNQSLLVHLENGFLSRGFDQFCSELHHYKQYADDFYDSQRALRTQVKKSKAFRRFKKLQEGRVEFNELKLEDLLELPLTRAIQYHVFLEELTSNTSPQHQDFTALSRVVVLLSDLSLRIRENSRREENLLYLQNIQRVLRPKTRIIQPGRWFLREGWLKVVPPRGSEGKLQLFFLMSDVLLQTRRSSALSLSGGDHLELQRVFPLKDCGLEKVFGHKGGEGGLLSLSFPDTKLLLMSCDQSDFNHWFRALSSALRDLQPKDPVLQCESSAPCRKRHATPAADSSSDTKRRKEDTAARASSCVLL